MDLPRLNGELAALQILLENTIPAVCNIGNKNTCIPTLASVSCVMSFYCFEDVIVGFLADITDSKPVICFRCTDCRQVDCRAGVIVLDLCDRITAGAKEDFSVLPWAFQRNSDSNLSHCSLVHFAETSDRLCAENNMNTEASLQSQNIVKQARCFSRNRSICAIEELMELVYNN